MAKKQFIRDQQSSITPTVVFTVAENAYKQGKRMLFLQGSSRSGKTFNLMIWLIVHAYQADEPLKIVIVRRTMPNLKRTAMKDFRDIMQIMGIWDRNRWNSVDHEYEFDNGSSVSFFATEDAGVAQGLKSDILFINEATEIKEEVWVQLTMRCTTFICIDYNPNFSDDFWIKKEILLPANKDKLVVSITTYKDNPFLTKEQVASIEKLKDTNERLWRIYGLGEQCLVEGLVYDHFETLEQFPPQYWNAAGVGIDWGYKDPFAVALVYPDEVNKRLYVQEVCYKSLLNEQQQIEVLLDENIRPRLMICDSAAPQFIASCRVKHHLRIRPTIKNSAAGRNSILPGISIVQKYTIVVCGNSPNLEKELRNYTYKQDRDGNYTSEPIDAYNHLLDAVRYYLYSTNHRNRNSVGVHIHL